MEQRRRPAPRLAVLLAAATIPALLIAGCSSGSGGGSGGDSAKSTPTTGSGTASGTGGTTAEAPTTPAVPVKYAALPASCKSVTAATVSALVPKAKTSGGTEAKSSDIASRGGCSWTGNGKDGYQYRWLSVALQRFSNDAQLGAGEAQAKKQFGEQVAALAKLPGGAVTSPLTGLGDQASMLHGRATIAKITSQNATVVARTGNVVVIVELDGAGLEGKKNPSSQTVRSGAQRAAKDVVAAVAAANA